VDKLRECFAEERIVADVEGKEKIPELSRVQGLRPPTERVCVKVGKGGMSKEPS
jgi:hypothetical protein